MLDIWTIRASSGDYPVPAETAGDALAQFTDTHPDDFVHAITSNDDTLTEADRATLREVLEIALADPDFADTTSGGGMTKSAAAAYRDELRAIQAKL